MIKITKEIVRTEEVEIEFPAITLETVSSDCLRSVLGIEPDEVTCVGISCEHCAFMTTNWNALRNSK